MIIKRVLITKKECNMRRDQNHWHPSTAHTDQLICLHEAAIGSALEYKQDYRVDFLNSYPDLRYLHFNAPNWPFLRVQKRNFVLFSMKMQKIVKKLHFYEHETYFISLFISFFWTAG